MNDQTTTFGPAGWTPDHYRGDGLQPFDVINAFGLDFYEGNAIKYLLRWRKKNGVEDLCKARTYVQILIDRAEQEIDELEQADDVDDVCRPVEIDGEMIRVHGGPGEMDDETRAALGEVIRTAKRKFLAEHPEHAAAADEEQTLRWARRESLLVLLTRLQRGRTLTEDEARTLRQHVEQEMREADTARTVAAGNKRHVQVMYAELESHRVAHESWKAEAEAAKKDAATADRVRAEAQRDRDQHAAVLAEVLAAFVHKVEGYRIPRRSAEADVATLEKWRSVVAPTAERPWWETVAEIRAELEQARAAIERVRAMATTQRERGVSGSTDHKIGLYDAAVAILAALDGPAETEG